MKASLVAGISKTERITVDRDRTVGFIGDDDRVYSTPALVNDIEALCRDLLLDHLDSGEDSVGTRVEIDHIAATPEGMWVDITAVLEKIDGRGCVLVVAAHDAVEPVANCRHHRFIIDLEKTKQRLAAKAAKARAA
ncbi:MAG: LysR family transcriptional regulator [Alphaproteobacteria bacterium]|nr:LysR family transcriptional regulator [Alphaproteobacteria bacterium]